MIQKSAIKFSAATLVLVLSTLPFAETLADSIQPRNDTGAGFADDFSADSLRYSAYSFGEVPDSGTASVVNGSLQLQAQKISDTDFGNIYVVTNEDTDTLIIKGVIDSATSLPSGSQEETAILAVEQRIYNSIADGGLNDGTNIGDVQFRFDLGIAGNGFSGNSFCFGEQTQSGYEALNVFSDGTENCSSFENITIATDVEYTYGFSLDRDAGQLTVFLNEEQVVVPLPGTLYQAENPFTGFQLVHQGGPGMAQATVSEVTTDGGTDRFDSGKPFAPYQGVDSSPLRSVTLDQQMLRLSAQATEDDDSGTQLRLSVPSDYIEAIVQIDSNTNLGERGQHFSEIRADLYNDISDGGVNGREGDVSAFITFAHDTSGRRSIEICMRRSNDAENNDSSGVLETGRGCITVPIRLELDTPYRSSIFMDRSAGTITFRVEGFTYVHTIETEYYPAAFPQTQVGTYPNGLSTVVMTIDNLRTSPTALTSAEIEAGESAPSAFPPALVDDDIVVDKTLSLPAFDPSQELTFFDDFDTPTARYGFWDGRDRGEVAVSGSAEGYVEFQVNSSDSEQGNYAEFYLDSPSDSVTSTVSLSSERTLPQDDRAQAAARVQGTFYNDLADGGTDGQLGDVYFSLQIRQRGDGVRDADLYMERRAADGSRDTRLRLVPDGENVFEGFAPELDTPYTLSLALDRTTNIMTASIGDRVQTIALEGDVYLAAQANKQVQIEHRGPSGRAVGRIHAIKTDQSSVDFSKGIPTLGPYRPAFNAGYRGVELSHGNGQVTLRTDSSLAQGRGADLQARGESDFVGATMTMSSDTEASGEGKALVGIGGLFYNEFADGGTEGATGSVYAALNMIMGNDEAGVPEIYFEYCAVRSSDESFSATTELIGGNPDNCPRFSTVAMVDVPYDLSIAFDSEQRQLEYRVGDEIQVFAIPTPAFKPHSRFNGARTRAFEGAKAVGIVDRLSYSADAVALAESDNAITVLTEVVTTTPTETGPVLNDVESNNSKSALERLFGCSISSHRGDPLFYVMCLFSLGLLVKRRIRYAFERS